MFREKDFLVSKGLSDKLRADNYWIIGNLYDKGENITENDIKNLREYLDKHRELIANKDYPIVKISTIKTHLEEMNLIKVEKHEKKVKNDLKYNDIAYKTGIYGIYIDDILVYIGKTQSGFKNRFQQHKTKINCSDEYKYIKLREAKKEGKQISMKPLVILEDLKVEKQNFTKREVSCMELALINIYQPIFNIEGIVKNYCFGKEYL